MTGLVRDRAPHSLRDGRVPTGAHPQPLGRPDRLRRVRQLAAFAPGGRLLDAGLADTPVH